MRFRCLALRSAWAVLALVLCSAATLASAQARVERRDEATVRANDDEARALFKIGKQAFEEGRYERAFSYFDQAYQLSLRPELLYNIATVLDRLRRDEDALRTYREYLTRLPAAENRPQVEERIRILEGALAGSAPQVAPTPAQVAAAQGTASSSPLVAAPASSTQARDDDGAGLHERWWFWAGIGGVVVTAVIIGVIAGSSGGQKTPAAALLDPSTRVREL